MAEDYPSIEKPIPYFEAFRAEGPAAVLSQGAFYLALGSQLHPEWRETLPREGNAGPFPLPPVVPMQGKFNREELGRFFQKNYDLNPGRAKENQAYWHALAAEVAQRLRKDREPDPRLAAFALTLGLMARDPVVRACAAISYADHFDQIEDVAKDMIYGEATRKPGLVRDLVGTWLGRAGRREELPKATAQFAQLRRWPNSTTSPTRACVLVNGTMPPSTSVNSGTPETWWRPGGDLYEHLRNGRRPDVTYHEWEGGYSYYAHEVAAKNFVYWQQHENLTSGMDVVTHSHGGNMTFLATKLGLKIRKLVLLSCPVHWKARQPEFANIEAAQSVRIRWDLVLLADRAGQEFPDNTIVEHILPYWFSSHSDSHLSSRWKQHGLDNYV